MYEWEKQRLRKYLPISIIVPTYNRANYLLETLNAILAQQDQDLEVIVVDDFSTDDSRIVLESFRKQHPQIVLVFLEENLGESNAVNVGWSLSSKQFISIVNSDDPPDRNWLRDMSNEIKTRPGFGFYYPNRLVIDENGIFKRKDNLRNWSTKDLFEKLIPIASAGLIINKEMLPTDFEPRDPCVDFPSDLIQMFRLGLLTEGYRVESAWGVWREHQNSLSGSENTQILSASFFSNIGAWLKENEARISVYSKVSNRTFYLFGNTWKIYRTRNGVYCSFRLFLKHELFRIVKQPNLIFILPFHFIKYYVLKIFKTSP
jgi:glycosyltransferase involved in cell wall biosynthesis